jgi:6-pyruvoyl-tetrahydropterin synthase
MTTMITIGGCGSFVFSAAHAGLHDGQFEPLHGHTFTVTLRLHGDIGETGMLADFRTVKEALTAVVGPLRRRTLMPSQPPGGRCWKEDGQVVIECGAKRYSLPCQDVVLLPVASTTTEAIAAYLLGQLMPSLRGESGLHRAELVLAEAADTAAMVSADVRSGR